MIVRVFQPPTGPVRIMRPIESRRLPDELDADFCARICNEDMQKDASLAGLPYVDLPLESLPQDRSTRDKWRLVDGKVVIAD